MKSVFIYLFVPCIFLFSLYSCEEVLLEKDISDETINLVAPADNTSFSSTSITFTWETVTDATSYRLQIARPNFANPSQIVLDTEVTTTSFTQQLNIGQYEWRVKGVNSAYSTPFKSRFLTVASNDDFSSNTVALSSPVNNLITKTALQNLSWQPVIGATNYQVQIYDSSNTIVSDETVTATNFNYTFAEGSYQWRVRAGNGTDYTLYSSRSILVDTTIPNTPTLTSPTNASNQPEGTINFVWNRMPISGSTEKDSIYIYTNSTLTNLQSKNESNSPFTSTLSAGTFYWFVKSFDEAGNMSAQSSVFNVILN